jgi:HEAT repeat protein
VYRLLPELFMSLSEAPPAKPEGTRAGVESLPAVTPPTATFILQLFLIPLLIVTIVVVLWLLFGWMAHMGRESAADLVRGIERGDNASGQLAFELAGLLRSPDPKFDALRRDPAVAKRLADFLARDLKEPVTARDESRLMRRRYLCRLLGEFHVPVGLEVLLVAAQHERDPAEVQVRYSAVEAIAALADHCGPESMQRDDVLKVLLDASRAQDGTTASPSKADQAGYPPHAELRAASAYALGVIGGEQATERLALMLHDAYPNARYNAATGLARYGDAHCTRVLREMLDPENALAVKDEANPNDQARKRTTVLLNGVKATLQLATADPAADVAPLKQSLQALVSSPLEGVLIDRQKVKAAAAEALRLIDAGKL